MNFVDSNEFIVANDSRPTYHAHINNNNTDTKNEILPKGETTPDITFFHSNYNLLLKNWY